MVEIAEAGGDGVEEGGELLMVFEQRVDRAVEFRGGAADGGEQFDLFGGVMDVEMMDVLAHEVVELCACVRVGCGPAGEVEGDLVIAGEVFV